jgi:predicted porin
MAQVTVYGLIDVGYSSTESKVTNGNKTEASSFGTNGSQSGSRLGFRGEEDLGGGMKAGFVYELGLDPTEAVYLSTTANNRQGFVSLSGGFGEIRLGRQYTGYFGVNAGFDAGSTFSGHGFLPTGAHTGWSGIARASNAVRYQTPTVSGFWLSVAAIDDASKTTSSAGVVTAKTETSGQTITGSYTAGPLAAMVSWSGAESEVVGTTNSKGDQNRLNVGASYNLGVLSLHLTHNQDEIDSKIASNLDTEYSDTTIGVRVPVGAATLWASTGEGETKRKGSSPVTANVDYSAYQIGASYALSKRTNVYAAIGETEAKAKSTGVKTTDEGMYFGVRHTF